MAIDQSKESLPATQGQVAEVLIAATICLAELTFLVDDALGKSKTAEQRLRLDALQERFRNMDKLWEQLTGYTENE